MKRTIIIAVALLALAVSVASANTVNLKLETMGAKGWTSVAVVDNSGRGGVYEKDAGYGGAPEGTFMFTSGNAGKCSFPWAAICTDNFNGVKISQITSLNIRVSGFEGAGSTWQPPHFTLSLANAAGNNRCMQWVPWSDGIVRDPGNAVDGRWHTYDALVDGSWVCEWMGTNYATLADAIAELGDLTITTGFYQGAWRGKGFNLGFANYDSSTNLYNSDNRGLVDWFDVGIDGVTTTYNLNAVPEPGSIAVLATGLVGLVGLRRRMAK